jgi:8-oxo-dGTP diphosphatase
MDFVAEKISMLAPHAFVRHDIDMTDSAEAHAPILAAGGIVFQGASKPRIAIVRLRRNKVWVLPKGKLYPGERALTAAKREVQEETGHEVSVHEFLGSISYPVDGRVKIVQFWRMKAIGGPVREPTNDVKDVKWLPLKEAIAILSRAHERVFLANVAPVVLEAARQTMRRKAPKPAVRKRRERKSHSAFGVAALHLIANCRDPMAKAIGGWIGRIAQSSMRRTG